MNEQPRITRVYRYGLLPPSENDQLVRGQLRLAHTYANRLTEIERARRAEMRAIVSSHGNIPELEAAASVARETLDALLKQTSAAKRAARTRDVEQATKDAIRDARDAVRETKKALSAARSALRGDPAIEAAKAEVEARYVAIGKKARAESAIYWGTYLLVEAANDASKKMPLYDGVEANDPKFTRWEGRGSLGVQLQGGRSADEMNATNLVRIEPRQAPPGVDPSSKRSAKRRHVTLAMRIGSGEKGTPIWGRWPMVMHRELPATAVIKRAVVNLRMIGPREEWCVLFTVQMPAPASRVPEGAPRLAVDIGWRAEGESGIRVAAWRNDLGETGFLHLPPSLLSQIQKADDLRSIRAKNLTLATTTLTQYVAAWATPPEWMPTNLIQWQSQARLAALANRWTSARFEGDEEAFQVIKAWAEHDHHLWSWESSQRKKALLHRREVYRIFAARMACKHSMIVLEQFDVSDVAKRPNTEDQKGDNAGARANRQLAAVSELRLCLTQAFGSRVRFVPAEFSTMTCAECGSLEVWDQAKHVTHTCSACSATWDQDENAAKNLLSYVEPCNGSGDVLKNVSESRWAKAKRMSVEKKNLRDVALRGAEYASQVDDAIMRNGVARPAYFAELNERSS